MKTKKYYKYDDPAHGWLRVKKTELVALKIEEKITGYSYERGDYAYLEEDRDKHTFLDAMEAAGKAVTVEYRHTNNRSRIRNYASYRVESHAEHVHKKKVIKALLDMGIHWGKSAIRKIKNGSYTEVMYWKAHYKLQVN